MKKEKKQNERRENKKRAIALDGVSTRVLIDISKDYISRNPKVILFRKRRMKKE
jgi:hypothetical protein